MEDRTQTPWTIERVGDITLVLEFWDCECEHSYIHPVTDINCDVCGVLQDDQPNSRLNEVKTLFM